MLFSEGKFNGTLLIGPDPLGATFDYGVFLEARRRLRLIGLTLTESKRGFEEYEKALRKHLSIHNGKLTKEFSTLYDELHIAGYYRGLLYHVDMVKAAFKAAKTFIDKLNG